MRPSDIARLSSVWRNMLRRCENPRSPDFHRYGGRGITVCRAWHDFDVFAEWAEMTGYAQGLQIDRRNNDGPYSPKNCHWVSRQTNANNKRSNTRVKIWGEEKTLAEWARDKRCAVACRTLTHRIQRLGWEPGRAMTQPSTRTANTCIHGHERTPESVGFNAGRRYCKVCHAEKESGRYHKQREATGRSEYDGPPV